MSPELLALGTAVAGLAGYIAVQFKLLLESKDARIADKDKQIAAQDELIKTLTSGWTDSNNVLKDLQAITERIERELRAAERRAKRVQE